MRNGILHRKRLIQFLALCALLTCCRAGGADSGAEPSRKAFFDLKTQQTEYTGPGRDQAPPSEVKEVLIGYFGPGDASHPEYGDVWRGAVLAVEVANRAGGYQGKPFRLAPVWSESPWASGIADLARMAYDDKVWAIVGGVDGPSTHLAEQVVAKARLTLISPGSTDRTANLANVPWLFSCLPGDQIQAPLLAEAIAGSIGTGRLVIASATDHDSRLLTDELKVCLSRRNMVPRYHFTFSRNTKDCPRLAERILETESHAVVILAGARDSACLNTALRCKGFAGLVFGGPSMGRRSFLEKTDASAEGAVFPLLFHCQDGGSREFADAFRTRFGNAPDYSAAYGYDSVSLLVAAVRKAGLNRARICDEVRDLGPWQGVTGLINWDGLGSNTMAVRLGCIVSRRVVPLPDTRLQPRRLP